MPDLICTPAWDAHFLFLSAMCEAADPIFTQAGSRMHMLSEHLRPQTSNLVPERTPAKRATPRKAHWCLPEVRGSLVWRALSSSVPQKGSVPSPWAAADDEAQASSLV
jgi:hypothetical protein